MVVLSGNFPIGENMTRVALYSSGDVGEPQDCIGWSHDLHLGS